MNLLLLFIITILLFLLEYLYFKLADRFNIIDQPNHRSSHTVVTLRGGGIIFAISLLLYPCYFGFQYKYFLTGLALISFISFMDDIKPVSSKLRILFHLGAVALMFCQLGLFDLPVYWIFLALFLVIGSLNAINFMDGINGITGSYALVTLCALLYINIYIAEFITSSLLITSIISVIVFNFFNFRIKAKCFAGDVGSVSIAFIILFFLLQLIIKTENFSYLLLLLLYGLDTVTTIGFRLIRKERVFEPHRSHFYQHWANEKKVPHLIVASIYALVQLIIDSLVIFFTSQSVFILCLSLFSSAIIFVIIRFSVEGSVKLLGR